MDRVATQKGGSCPSSKCPYLQTVKTGPVWLRNVNRVLKAGCVQHGERLHAHAHTCMALSKAQCQSGLSPSLRLDRELMVRAVLCARRERTGAQRLWFALCKREGRALLKIPRGDIDGVGEVK